MPLRIFNNLSSAVAQNRLDVNNRNLGEAIGRVASGDRETGAAEKSVSELLRSDARTLRQSSRNLNDGISLVNVAEGGLNEQSGILIRIRELLSSADGALGETERGALQLEINSLRNEFNRISSSSEFNGQKLLDGSLAADATTDHVVVVLGLDSDESGRIDLNEAANIGSTDTTSLDLDGLSVANLEEAVSGLAKVDEALTKVSAFRGSIGATQNRFTRALNTLNVAVENLTAASATVKNGNIAEELTELTRQQLLVQSSAAMVGQANLIPEGVLLLLQQ
jgi:flagellin